MVSETNLSFTEEMLRVLKAHTGTYTNMAVKLRTDIGTLAAYKRFLSVIRFASLAVKVTERVEFVLSADNIAADLLVEISGEQIQFKVNVISEPHSGVFVRSLGDIVRELRENILQAVQSGVRQGIFVVVIEPQTSWNSSMLLNRISVDLESELRGEGFSAVSGLVILYPSSLDDSTTDETRNEGVLIVNPAANYVISNDLANKIRKVLSSSKRLKRYAMAYVKQQLIGIVQAAVALSVFLVIIMLSNQYVVSYFPGQIEHDTALVALQAIVTADSALLGFVGIIAVFLFQALQNLQTRLLGELKPMRRLDKIADQRANMVWMTLFTISMFVLSLFSTLTSMSWVTYPNPPTEFYWPLALMLEGLAGIFFMIWYSARW